MPGAFTTCSGMYLNGYWTSMMKQITPEKKAPFLLTNMRMQLSEAEITKIQPIGLVQPFAFRLILFGTDGTLKFRKVFGGMQMLPLWDFELCVPRNNLLHKKLTHFLKNTYKLNLKRNK